MDPCTQTYANMTGVNVGQRLWGSFPPGLEQELPSAHWAVIPNQPKHLPQLVLPAKTQSVLDSAPSADNCQCSHFTLHCALQLANTFGCSRPHLLKLSYTIKKLHYEKKIISQSLVISH